MKLEEMVQEKVIFSQEGTGPATMSAYVEIIFDNSDNRFPTGKDEVVLRRTIGLKKDEYSLDKKSATKADVMNLLESAGFSRSNPYYIVPQGRITALTNAKDHERLHLLKEVAGTRVYEQRRQESMKIMEETDMDRERRCLEYTIYHREQTDLLQQLQEMDEAREKDVRGSDEQNKEYDQQHRSITEIENQIHELQENIEFLKIEKEQLDDDKRDHIKVYAQIELEIKDLEETTSQNHKLKRKREAELRSVEADIQRKESELNEVLPNYERELHQEAQLNENLEQAELRRQALYAKQGRSIQFRTRAERDRWLQEEMAEIKRTISVQQKQASDLEDEIENIKRTIVTTEVEIQNKREQLEQRKKSLEQMNTDLNELKAKRDKLTDERKERWREDAQLDTKLSNTRELLRKSERSLMGSMDKNTSAGLALVKKITERYKLKGVYGPLFELFECVSDSYWTAVEVTAGQSLFHVVVDTDETATKVLKALNEASNGRVTFMPLNRLHPKPCEYPADDDVKPMLEVIKFGDKYAKAFQQVFSRTIICSNLETCATFARSHGLNCITMSGDRVDRKGALSGGYHDVRRRRLEASSNYKRYRSDCEELEGRASAIKSDITRLDQSITRILGQMQLIEARRRQAQDSRDPLIFEINSKIKEEASLRESKANKEKSLQNVQTDIRMLTAQYQAHQTEMGTELAQQLTPQEGQQLAELNASIEDLRERLARSSTTRSQLEIRKNVLENELNANLKRRRDEFVAQIESLTTNEDARLSVNKKELEKTIRNINKRTEEIEKTLRKLSTDLTDKNEELEKAKADQEIWQQEMERHQKVMEKFLSKRSLLLKKKEECQKNIRELGALPDAAFEKYTSTDLTKLLKMLHKVREGLKKYNHVNKKAFEQYNNFTKQRDTLTKRKIELDQSKRAIADLIDVLDQRKDEAIERTFKQVAKYFSEVFEKLVPAGRGQLIMLRHIDRVSFNSKTDEGLRMQQLSGGQKSLVALTLIFAIQQCDPAPFYLFDEIDAALDAQYRTAVASMIHELSENGQFITTTFRPEMLANTDKFYGVTFSNKVSRVNCITKEDALNFVEQEQPQ
ncbi:3318_t:CDS:10 [Paraglomus brasilianum]|uniref:3318_t:CDS:1 n=1 Tax=Paraglomus brasilianum TaxID=144538 RepID=A0A9N9BWA7_9GLOM|nr:3318_t:CDS:10 [Paraglomus brasilianum]